MAKQVTATGPVEGPWALPDGWRWERLGAVLPLSYGRALKATERLAGDVPVYGSAGITGFHSTALCKKPALIVGRKGSAGAIYHATGPSYAIDTAYYCSVDTAKMDLRLGYYLLRHLDLRKLDQSTAVPSLSRDPYDALVVPLPPDELQPVLSARIDELFAEVDDGEAALARARADLATWRKALLKAAVTGELTADWRAANPPTETGDGLLARILSQRRTRWNTAAGNGSRKYREPAKPDMALFKNSPVLPAGWAWASAAQLTTLVTSGSRGWAEYYSNSGAIFIRAQNINADRLCLAGVAYVNPPENGEGSRTKVSKGDILVTITGANVTKSALVDVDLDEAYVSQHVGLMRPVDVAVSDFFYWWIVTPAGGRAILEKLAYGAGKPGLNLPNLSGLPVALPPLAEQREIARICLSADAEKVAGHEMTAELQQHAATLRQSILAAAFRGDLA